MSDEPAAKRARIGDEPAVERAKNADEFPNLRSDLVGAVKEKLIELDAVQHQLDVMSEKAAEEVLRVEKAFNKKRMPIYEKRKALTTKIDHFWQTAFLNHHLLSTAIPEEQEDLLGALRDLEVQEFEDIRSGFRIVMTFDQNEYFENTVITKSYHLQSETPSTQITEIKWRENKKPPPKPEDESAVTFLEWLNYAAPPDSDEIAEVIKDDLFVNPLQYYVMPDMQEVDVDEIESFLNEDRGVDENGQPIPGFPRPVDLSTIMANDDSDELGEEAVEEMDDEEKVEDEEGEDVEDEEEGEIEGESVDDEDDDGEEGALEEDEDEEEAEGEGEGGGEGGGDDQGEGEGEGEGDGEGEGEEEEGGDEENDAEKAAELLGPIDEQ
ncbi:hypothetical protein GCK72_008975 [Caenorhabditis remanei]|uniref:Uncharacterized protein n=1 Tax=Caenorhabditis remanei TaxID=31234 RepID=A0A6A5H1Q3_CAERE|nr:hypothetical protein GCK72_008975 [Caenorhabditis remanei]KAF1760726.1 hypothetical protein GCK72_008975 [Caenorhabditis remanei]